MAEKKKKMFPLQLGSNFWYVSFVKEEELLITADVKTWVILAVKQQQKRHLRNM